MDIDGAGAGARTLALVGAGRAGSALAAAATSHGWRATAVASRSRIHAASLAAAVGARVARNPAEAARSATLTLVAVPDLQITSVGARIAASGHALAGRVIAHCGASLGPEVLAAVRQTGAAVGVVHPLQALSGSASAELLPGSYFRIEGDGAAIPILRAFVRNLGGHVLDVPASARVLYHAAAVLAGNAPLVLLQRATALLVEAGVAPEAAHASLAALLEGSAHNARRLGAAAALTGPVVRNDAGTVGAHVDSLAAEPETRELYVRLAREMLVLAGLEGRAEVAAVLDAASAPVRPRIAGKRVA